LHHPALELVGYAKIIRSGHGATNWAVSVERACRVSASVLTGLRSPTQAKSSKALRPATSTASNSTAKGPRECAALRQPQIVRDENTALGRSTLQLVRRVGVVRTTTVADLKAAHSCGGLVFLICSSGDDPDRIVRQRPLQRSCLSPWGAHPLAREKPAVS